MSQVPVVGDTRTWSRDLALVGGVTGFAAPTAMFGWLVSPAFCVAAGPAGAAIGWALGRFIPWLLERVRGRVPIPVLLLLLGPALGAFWGGGTGLVAGLLAELWYASTGSEPALFAGTLPILGASFGLVAGAVQLGWFWFPYTFQTVRRAPRWPVMALAMLLAPLTAFAVYVPGLLANI